MFKSKFYIPKKILISLFTMSLFGSFIIAMNPDIPKDLISKLAKENAKTNYLSEVTNVPEVQTLIAGYLDSNGYNKPRCEIEGALSGASTFSNDGQNIAIRGDDNGSLGIKCNVLICDTQSKSVLCDLKVDSPVTTILYSPKDKYIVCSYHNEIIVYNISDSTYIQRIPIATGNICFSHDGLYFAFGQIPDYDRRRTLLKIIDFNKFIKAKSMVEINKGALTLEHATQFGQFVFLKNNGNIVSLEADKINIWDISKIIPFRTKQIDEKGVTCLTSLSSANLFATAAQDKIKIWDIDNKECKSTINIHNSIHILSILFSPCGKYLAVLFRDSIMTNDLSLKVLFFYNELESICIYRFNGVLCGNMTYSPCGNYLMVGKIIYELRNQNLEILTNKYNQNFSNSDLLSKLVGNIADLKYVTLKAFEDNPKCVVCDSENAKLKCKFECNLVNYCSRDCKNGDWHQHSEVCPNNITDSNRLNNTRKITVVERTDMDFDNDDHSDGDEEAWG